MALYLDFSLPVSEVGPVDFLTFSRLAAACFSEVFDSIMAGSLSVRWAGASAYPTQKGSWVGAGSAGQEGQAADSAGDPSFSFLIGREPLSGLSAICSIVGSGRDFDHDYFEPRVQSGCQPSEEGG